MEKATSLIGDLTPSFSGCGVAHENKSQHESE